MGDDEAMLGIVTSANVACGGHAGDPETMFRTAELAAANDVTMGAHPGYVDPAGFGRRIIPMSAAEITRMVAAQIGGFVAVAAVAGATVRYVKAHGALANLAARDADVARAVARAVRAVDADLALLAISGTELERVGRAEGLDTYAEIFADRGYLPDGQLVPRGEPGAMIHDATAAAERLFDFLDTGRMPVVDGGTVALDAHSVCVHGDSPGAVEMARSLRARFEADGVTLASFLDHS